MTDQTMDNLLDETLDDLADLPTSAPFPAGHHVAQMFVTRDAKKPTTYVVKFKHKGPCELSEPTATPPKEGDEALMFIHTKKKDGTKNEIGQGQLKEILKPVSERLQTTSIQAILDALKSDGVEVGITSGVKDQKDTSYAPQMFLKKIELT